MTRQEFIEEIKQLSIEDRIALIEAITRSLRKDLSTSSDVLVAESESLEAGDADRERKIAAVRRLRGTLKSEGHSPSDEDLREEYTNYLTEKYS